MADLEGALNAVWRNENIYKLRKASLRNNLLSVFSGFLNDRHIRLVFNWKRCTTKFYLKSLYFSAVYCRINQGGYYS